MMVTLHEKTGDSVAPGDTVTDFRGGTATFLRATSARIPGKSGKVLVRLPDGGCMEYYDKVYDLAVIEGNAS
jgi:hypothetical protein